MSHLRLHRKGARRSSLFVSAPATPERHRESEPLLMSQTIDYGNTSLNSVSTTLPPHVHLLYVAGNAVFQQHPRRQPASPVHCLPGTYPAYGAVLCVCGCYKCGKTPFLYLHIFLPIPVTSPTLHKRGLRACNYTCISVAITV